MYLSLHGKESVQRDAWQVPEVEDDDRERWGEKRTSACGRADAIKVLLVGQNFQLSSPSLEASGTSCSLERATQSLGSGSAVGRRPAY